MTKSGKVIKSLWDGHCWIEIDGYVGDLSIFRTAYSIEGNNSRLKEFILRVFGANRGAMLAKRDQLPPDMKYIPKFVLTDNQINGLVAGMAYKLESDTHK